MTCVCGQQSDFSRVKDISSAFIFSYTCVLVCLLSCLILSDSLSAFLTASLQAFLSVQKECNGDGLDIKGVDACGVSLLVGALAARSDALVG